MKLNYSKEVYTALFAFVFPCFPGAVFAYLRDFQVFDGFSTISYFSTVSIFSTFVASLFLEILFSRQLGSFKYYSVAWRAGFLGSVFIVGLFLSFDFDRPASRPFGFYLCILSFFHWSEYFSTAITSSETLRLDSFLLNHSLEYWAAAMLSWMEFAIEIYLFPSIKSITLVTWIGVGLCFVGEVFRKMAMLTAGRNFTHLIQYQKRSHHQLITHGIYSLFRHPSYVGWFWWSIGTQLTLCNPICAVIYALISWRFFNDRIYHEEITLINFFGGQYVDYQKRVPTGLPGIAGFIG